MQFDIFKTRSQGEAINVRDALNSTDPEKGVLTSIATVQYATNSSGYLVVLEAKDSSAARDIIVKAALVVRGKKLADAFKREAERNLERY